MKIPIAQPIIGPKELAAVESVIRSGMLAQGPKVAELEEMFAAYTGTKFAVAVNSGTAALHSALYAAGIQPGDEVITTPFSFIATINPILMIGAKPVLVDIDPKTFNINPKELEQAITSKTKAIIPVHLYGQPADMDEINRVADEHNIVIVEDACQAVGAEYKNKKTGSLGSLGCFSLYATKNIMSGEGGIITTDEEEYAKRMKRFRQHGMTGPYEYAELGYNYRMTDLQAAIAIEQLKQVDDFNAARVRNAQLLSEGLKDISGINVPETSENRTHVYHQFTIRLLPGSGRSRDQVLAKLHELGIGAGAYYPKPLHAYPHIAKLGYKLGDFPEAEKAAEQVLSLPVHPRVTEDDIREIVDAVKDAVRG